MPSSEQLNFMKNLKLFKNIIKKYLLEQGVVAAVAQLGHILDVIVQSPEIFDCWKSDHLEKKSKVVKKSSKIFKKSPQKLSKKVV